MKPFFALLFAFVFPLFLMAQNRSITIYSKSNDALFLVLEIEKILSELTIDNATEEVFLFDKVINVNRKIENQSFNKNRRQLIDYYDNRLSFELSENARTQRLEESKELYQGDLFLFVQINSFNPLIEYQFSLHEVINDSFYIEQNVVPFPEINTKPLKINDFFISPSEDYSSNLKDEIQKLFPKTNRPPIAKISVKNSHLQSDSRYYFTVGDTIRLSARESFDYDSPRDKFFFTWRQVNPDTNNAQYIPVDKDLNIISNVEQQNLPLNTVGNYLIAMSVNDGVEGSIEDTIRFSVVPPIQIYVKNINILHRRFQTGLLQRRPKFTNSQKEKIYGSISLNVDIDRKYLQEQKLDTVLFSYARDDRQIKGLRQYAKYGHFDYLASLEEKMLGSFDETIKLNYVNESGNSLIFDYDGEVKPADDSSLRISLSNRGIRSNDIVFDKSGYSDNSFFEISGGLDFGIIAAPRISINTGLADSISYNGTFSAYLSIGVFLTQRLRACWEILFGLSKWSSAYL